jgi:hypothetical protein
MDLDPEGIFRDDSDEDDDNLHVRSLLRALFISPFPILGSIYVI